MQIELTKQVAATPAVAFEVVSNVTDWPKYVDAIESIEVLTPGPVRTGTRLRERRTLFGRESTHEMEVAEIERPHRFRLFIDHPDFHYELDHLIDAVYGGGCRLTRVFRSRPQTTVGHAAHPFLTPYMEITLRDELERDLTDLAAAISAQSSLHDVRAS